MPGIKFQNLKKVYPNGFCAIEGLNLEIDNGAFAVMVGPSGCGKTTLLRMLAGLEDVTEGQVFIGGNDVTKKEPGDRGLAMVFQNYAIYPHMTVQENIEFGLKNIKLPKQEIAERTESVLKQTGISEYAKRKPGLLSGGQRQRVALARAISKAPDVFLMDEPLSNLDANLRNQMRSEIIQLHRRLGSTFVYVTHDQVEAMTMGSDIVVMDKGKIMQKASPKEIYSNPKNIFVAKFIGDPGMNLLKTESGYLGIRPRDIVMDQSGERGVTLSAQVITREMLGYDTLYNLNTAFGEIRARSMVEYDFETRMNLFFAEEHLYYFDNDGQRTHDEAVIARIRREIEEGK